MMKRKGKIRWGTVFAAVAGVVGVLGDPAVLGYLPHGAASAVAAAGVIVAALKKSIVREEHER